MRAKLFPTKRLALCGLGALAISLVPQAQIEVVRRTQVLLDSGGGSLGTVASLRKVAVSGLGDGLAEVDATGTSPGDEFVWTGFGLGIREGDVLSAPAGATVGDVDSMRINTDGDIAYNLRLLGQPSATNEGIYIGDPLTLLLQEGDDMAPFGFNAGTYLEELDYLRMSPRNGSGNVFILVDAIIDDGGSDFDSVLLIETNSDGSSFTISAVLSEGDTVDMSADLVCPLPPATITAISRGVNTIDVNENGETIIVARVSGGSANDYLVLKNGTSEVVAREGCPSPAGPNWSSLGSAEVGINDLGDTVVSGVLSGPSSVNLLIAKNDTVFRREGDNFSGIGSGTISSFGGGPIDIEDGSGQVLWYGEWSGAIPGAALFKNDAPLIQVDQTQASGATVTSIDDSFDGYSISPDGSRVIAILETLDMGNTVEGVWHVGQSSSSSIVEGLACSSLGTLSHTAGTAAINDSFTLTFSDGPANIGVCVLFFSPKTFAGTPASTYNPAMDCGFVVPGLGDLFILQQPLIDVFPLFGEYKIWTGATPIEYTFDLSATLDPPSLVGLEFIWQGAFFSGAAAPQPIRLTNAVKTIFGF